MKIIHIVSKPPNKGIQQIIFDQSKLHEVVIINLDAQLIDYEEVVNLILSGDKVISWTNIQDATIH